MVVEINNKKARKISCKDKTKKNHIIRYILTFESFFFIYFAKGKKNFQLSTVEFAHGRYYMYVLPNINTYIKADSREKKTESVCTSISVNYL